MLLLALAFSESVVKLYSFMLSLHNEKEKILLSVINIFSYFDASYLCKIMHDKFFYDQAA